MALLKREYGGIQPYIPAGIFRIRIPFIHFNISAPEVITGLMNAATSYSALAVLTSTLGLDANVAWALVIFETCMYSCNWLLGEPSVCGWITSAMAIVIAYLEGFDDYTVRLQAMTACQLELGLLFLILGLTGLAKQLNTLVPTGVKGGIVLGAGVNAVYARMATGGAMDTATWGCLAGVVVVFFLMFSLRIRVKMETNKLVAVLGNYSFLFAVIALFIVGGVTGEFDYTGIGQEGIIRVPDLSVLFGAVSPFSIGFAAPDIWLQALPIALIAWVIAFGDFVTVQQLGIQAMRDDEFIELDPGRTNAVCGIRNVLLSLFAPYPALAGPLSPPYCVATYQRYKQGGREGMDSIYDGSATNLIFTMLGLFIYPVYQLAAASSSAILLTVMCIQGYICTQICFDMCFDKVDQGVAGMMAGFILARGGGVGLVAGVFLYLLLADKDKILGDYHEAAKRQHITDEETEKKLAAAAERRKASKAAHDEQESEQEKKGSSRE
ncbi:MAG: hypothetical protein ACOX1O_06575 [Eggerthellaceae bacterium]|jgi:hypothetical protein